MVTRHLYDTQRSATGLAAFRRAYLVFENSNGEIPDFSDADTKVYQLVNGMLSVSPEVEINKPEEDRNSLAEFHSRIITATRSTLSWEGPATFNNLTPFLAMGLVGNDTLKVTTPPSGLGTATGAHFYNFTPNLHASNQQKSATVFFGDNIQGFYIPYVMPTQITLSGSMGEPVEMSVELFGGDLFANEAAPDSGLSGITDAFQTSNDLGDWESETKPLAYPSFNANKFDRGLNSQINDPSHDSALVALRTEFFIDDEWIKLGETLKSTNLRSFEITIPTGLNYYLTAHGGLDYKMHVEGKRQAAVNLTYIGNKDSLEELRHFGTGIMRAIRIRIVGPNIVGTIPNQLIFDANIRYDENPEIFQDDEGINTMVLNGHTYPNYKDNNSETITTVTASRGTNGLAWADDVKTVTPWPAGATAASDPIKYWFPKGHAGGNDFRVLLVNELAPDDLGL